MRLNKKWVTYGVIIGFVAALTTLGIVQAQQMTKKSSLSDEIDTANHNLSVLEAAQAISQSELDAQMDGAQDDSDAARTQLSKPVDSIIANESLFIIAETSSVTLTSMTVSPLSDDILAELACSYLQMQVTATGSETALLDFISRLNTDLSNGLVRSATLNIPDTPAEGEAEVNIELLIYTYQGG